MTVKYISINVTIHEAIAIRTKYSNANQNLRKVAIQILKF